MQDFIGSVFYSCDPPELLDTNLISYDDIYCAFEDYAEYHEGTIEDFIYLEEPMKYGDMKSVIEVFLGTAWLRIYLDCNNVVTYIEEVE